MADPASRIAVSELLTEPTVELHLRGNQRDEIFRELINRIPAIQERPEARQALLTALQEREQLHSTGIGDGVAIPHARNAIPGLSDQAVLVFGRHPTGIDYGAIDDAPVRIFFLLVAPTVTQHLHILARLSRLLRDAELRRQLLEADKTSAVLETIQETETRV